MSDVTTNTATVVDDYLAALSEGDAASRARLVSRAWDEDGRFVDPLLDVRGHEAIGDIAVAVREQFPGHTFRRTSGIDVHHDRVRFTWALVGPDGAVALSGIDVGEVAEDGRLRQIVGFFGDVPEGAEAA
jgi:SnoaL-like protein